LDIVMAKGGAHTAQRRERSYTFANEGIGEFVFACEPCFDGSLQEDQILAIIEA
jgi:hypothetical protein